MTGRVPLEGFLVDTQRAAEAILQELGWPTDPRAPFYSQTRQPLRRRTAKALRDRERGLSAYSVLCLLQMVRDAVANGDARVAAYYALQAGIWAYDGTANWAQAIETTRKVRKGGLARGLQVAKKARGQDDEIRRLLARYRATADEPTPSGAAAWIARRVNKHPRTIQRRLKKLGQ